MHGRGLGSTSPFAAKKRRTLEHVQATRLNLFLFQELKPTFPKTKQNTPRREVERFVVHGISYVSKVFSVLWTTFRARISRLEFSTQFPLSSQLVEDSGARVRALQETFVWIFDKSSFISENFPVRWSTLLMYITKQIFQAADRICFIAFVTPRIIINLNIRR